MSCSDRNLIGMAGLLFVVCCLSAGYCWQSDLASFWLVKFDKFTEKEDWSVNAFINVYDNLFPLKVAPMFFLLNIGGKIMVDTNCQGY